MHSSRHFGTTADDPANVNIPAADMQAFLDGPFSDLFDDPAWSTTGRRHPIRT